jgi:hypothetical protein
MNSDVGIILPSIKNKTDSLDKLKNYFYTEKNKRKIIMKKIFLISLLFLTYLMPKAWALDASIPLKVWVNQAIINTYTFSDKDWQIRQKDIGSYFMPNAWQAYLDAINKSNIIKLVTEKKMSVSAVATLPPTIQQLSPTVFKATMPILIVYKSDTDTQVQHLSIELQVIKSNDSGTGGFAINQFQATIDAHPCSCENGNSPKVTIV